MRPISARARGAGAGHAAGADSPRGCARAGSPARADARMETADMTIDRPTGACNEVLAPWTFAAAVRLRRRARLSRARGRALHAGRRSDDHHRRAGERAGARSQPTTGWRSAACTGCWWRRQGLSISNPDAAVRARTRAVIDRADRAVREARRPLPGARLAGAAQSRRRPDRCRRAGARDRGLGLPPASRRHARACIYCIEPLSRDQTAVVNTIAEALAIVEAAGLPGLSTMLDTSSAGRHRRPSRCRR